MALNGKVALVAGASRGVGEYIAKYLAKAGAFVAVAARTEEVKDKRLPGTIYSVSEDIRAAGGTALPVRLDLRDPESIEAGIEKTVAEFGRLDIVVNNAAIFVPGTIETVQLRHLDLIWQINLRGPLLVIGKSLRHLREAGGGHIVNISSGGAIFPGPGPYPKGTRSGQFLYGMLKAGMERVTQSLAIDLQQDNVAVNVLSLRRTIKTPGNIFFQQDPENPKLEFEPADEMGKATVWICEQPMTYTGHIDFEDDIIREHGL